MNDPYASIEASMAVIRPDTRTPAEKKLDQMLDERWANEQGVDAVSVLRQIAIELIAQQPQAEAKTVYRLAETDIYDFAGWLTTRPGVMEVGSSKEAGPMAEAVGEYLRAYPERFAPQQAEAVPAKEDFCYCNDEISLQIVSGGGAPEGLYGRVTLRVNGEYVNYVRADSWQETPRARALEFVARHKSSDWPERCQQMVNMARAALATPHHAEAVPSDVVRDAEAYHWLAATLTSSDPHTALQAAFSHLEGNKAPTRQQFDAAIYAAIAAQGEKP